MFRRIVVGLDFSASSLAALRWVVREFADRADVHIVHVIPDPRGAALLRPHIPETANAFRDADDIYQALRGLARTADAECADVNILKGLPSDGLALAAEELEADLVCVGKSRQRRGGGRFGATTPHRLLSRTNVPLLAVPETTRAKPGAVVAAVSDGSESRHVVQTAARIATAHGVPLDALHALEPDVQESAATARRLGCDNDLPTIAQNWLAARTRRVSLNGPSTTTLTPVGDAGEEIVAHAARGHAGLIVAGRYRQRDDQPATTSPGSSTRLLLWAAPCPVLVLGTVRIERMPRRRIGRRTTPALAVVTDGGAA